ncbi:MAG: DUF309 domain-containing protein [Dehalococcoidia bacterium]|nr:DUF309 domain-containing protein [Dehalococcoidia bacterium]
MPRQPTAIDPDSPAWQALAKGIQEFNSWRFYDCHETLEDVWLEAGGKTGDASLANLYQGLIKVAAGFHHLLRDNHRGAVSLLADSLRLLEPFRPAALGIDVERLVADVSAALEAVRALGPERIREFDRSTIPAVGFQRPPVPARGRSGSRRAT